MPARPSVKAAPVFSGTFRDLDDLGEAIRVADVEFTVTVRGALRGWTASADIGRSVFQAGGMSLPHVARASIDRERMLVYLLLDGAMPPRIRGYTLEPGHMGLYQPGAEHQHSTRGPFTFATVAVSEDAVASAVTAIGGADWAPLTQPITLIRPDPRALRDLRRRLTVLATVAKRHPRRLGTAAARRDVEREVLDAVARALTSAERPKAVGRPSSHSRVVEVVEEFLHANRGEHITVTDMCRAARATERSLRNAFGRVYGMGPNRFLRLHRLSEAHRMLRVALPSQTVTRIATELGIWDLGRFAGEYRHLFGESPSETLARAHGSQSRA
jgi:AraC family transcriptional regulator, ethanolamine operon transcriptional activator